MTCAEFQKVLPYIIETGGNAEEEAHLSACSVCSDLVTDLRYIAEQAKLLLPMHDPSPQVWDNIQGSLEREGLVRPARARGRLLGTQPGGIISYGWVAAAATAAVLLIVGLHLYSRAGEKASHGNPVSPALSDQPQVSGESLAPSRLNAQDDEQLLSAVQTAHPELRNTYEASLKLVNAYIQDAEKTVQDHPEDYEARQQLLDAYDQKTMVYEIATRSLQ
jgi:hypothetical protein